MNIKYCRLSMDDGSTVYLAVPLNEGYDAPAPTRWTALDSYPLELEGAAAFVIANQYKPAPETLENRLERLERKVFG